MPGRFIPGGKNLGSHEMSVPTKPFNTKEQAAFNSSFVFRSYLLLSNDTSHYLIFLSFTHLSFAHTGPLKLLACKLEMCLNVKLENVPEWGFSLSSYSVLANAWKVP